MLISNKREFVKESFKLNAKKNQLGSFLYGLMMKEITQWLIFALWIMAAGIWLPSILQVIWWRFNSWGYLSSWIANLGLSWLVVWILPEFQLIPAFPDYLQFWIMMILGALIYIPVTFLTPTEDMNRLVKYYVMSRPLGWWNPVRKEAERRGLLRFDDDHIRGRKKAKNDKHISRFLLPATCFAGTGFEGMTFCKKGINFFN